jgi:hypothetical protein
MLRARMMFMNPLVLRAVAVVLMTRAPVGADELARQLLIKAIRRCTSVETAKGVTVSSNSTEDTVS